MNWKTQTLGEICDEGGGLVRTGPFGSQLHESDYSEEGMPVVMPKDIIEGRVSEKSIARIDADHVERLAQHKLLIGDIVYGRRGDIGRQALITEKEAGWLCGTGCLKISLGKSNINPTFLHYYLRDEQVIDGIAKQAIGATMPNLNTSILRSIPITYPPKQDQEKIIDILSSYDDLIENNTRRIAVLEETARRIYENWFINFRFPEHETIQMVESVFGLMPKDWEILQIVEVADLLRGKSYRSSELAEVGGLPFVNLKCIDRDGGFRKSGIKRFTGEYKESQRVFPGDMVIAVTDMTQDRRLVARCGRIPRLDSEFGVISMDLVKLHPKNEYFRNFLYAMFRWSSFPDEVKQHANGANVLHLSPDRIAEYKFIKPKKDIVERFSKMIEPLLNLIDVLENKKEILRETQRILLPKLISGELDVSYFPDVENV